MSSLRILAARIEGFRNLEPVTLAPGPHFNVFFGPNGAGKSNIAEALAYLGHLKSFRFSPNAALLQDGATAFRLRYKLAQDSENASAALPDDQVEILAGQEVQRKYTLNGKRPRSLAAWSRRLPVVVFHAGHLQLAQGASTARRDFLDDILCRSDPHYRTALAHYQRALRSRNRLLRDSRQQSAIQAYDPILATHGSILVAARGDLVRRLGPWVTQHVSTVLDMDQPVTLQLQTDSSTDPEIQKEALGRGFQKDITRGTTTLGPHRDDLQIEFRKWPTARHHASQGQQRTIALALKLAELSATREQTGIVPILILDDVSSELDPERNRRLFQTLASLGNQVFLTTTHPSFIRLEENRKDFEIQDGRVIQTS